MSVFPVTSEKNGCLYLGTGSINLTCWFGVIQAPKLRGLYEQSLLAERRSNGTDSALFSEEPRCATRR